MEQRGQRLILYLIRSVAGLNRTLFKGEYRALSPLHNESLSRTRCPIAQMYYEVAWAWPVFQCDMVSQGLHCPVDEWAYTKFSPLHFLGGFLNKRPSYALSLQCTFNSCILLIHFLASFPDSTSEINQKELERETGMTSGVACRTTNALYMYKSLLLLLLVHPNANIWTVFSVINPIGSKRDIGIYISEYKQKKRFGKALFAAIDFISNSDTSLVTVPMQYDVHSDIDTLDLHNAAKSDTKQVFCLTPVFVH